MVGDSRLWRSFKKIAQLFFVLQLNFITFSNINYEQPSNNKIIINNRIAKISTL